ncbi:cytochrome c-type biogenesis CcmF C-terminal domain-containing protein [Chloroflexota bacterium]
MGHPFFNQVNGPIFLAIILLTGVCALIGWRQASIKNLVYNFLWPLVVALTLGIALFLLGVREWPALISFPVCSFVLFTILSEWFRGTRARHRIRAENYLRAFLGLIGANRPRYGGYIVHIGIIILAMGVVGSSLYAVETEETLIPGESIVINDYTLTYENRDSYLTQSKQVDTTTLSVYKQGKLVGELIPEKYFHRSYEQAVSEVAIRYTLLEDLYVILLGSDEDGTASFKVLVNPLVSWIWFGGGVLMLGGLITFWPDRRKPPAPRQNKARRIQK